MIKRDAYHDYMTDEEVAELGFWAGKTWSKRVASLSTRGGGKSAAARVWTWYDHHASTMCAALSYDSRSWTGL